MKKRTVILFNLGGPRNKEEVFPFLLSLFNDPAILPLPQPFRYVLARYIAFKRTPEAHHIYAHLNGASPLYENTKKQAQDLEKVLGKGYQVLIAMRHAPPTLLDAFSQLNAHDPQEVILLPLYPQFSQTTTGSSFLQWEKTVKKNKFSGSVRRICCYPRLPGFLEAVSSLIVDTLPLFQNPPRLLFCAHGLPQRLIEKGDVYVSHVQQSVQGVLENLNKKNKNLDWRLCYQSRVGPMEWTKPYVEETLKEAAADQRSVLLIPIAFVSEHSETLVELDIMYKNLAKEIGILEYHRVPTVSCHPAFIQGLAHLVQQSEQAENGCENTLTAAGCIQCGKKI